MSLAGALLTQADRAFKSKNWEQACKFYDSYFTKAYPDQDNAQMSIPDSVHLINYGQCLLEKLQPKPEQGQNKYDKEEIEYVTEYLLTARQRLLDAEPGTYPVEKLIDTYEYLGRIGLINNQFKRAADEFRNGYTRASNDPAINFRIRLSFLFYQLIALESMEKPLDGIEIANLGIELITQELAKATGDDVTTLNEIKTNFETKKHELEQDAQEQAANKDVLKPEEEEEEEDDDDEEEEEDAKDLIVEEGEENPEDKPPASEEGKPAPSAE